jgi:hypothetical protein
MADCGWSDHRPMELEVQLENGSTRVSRWKMSAACLNEVKEEVAHLYRAQPATATFFKKIKTVTHFYRSMCKKKAMDGRVAKAEMWTQLAQATSELDKQLEDPAAQQRQGENHQQLQMFETKKVAGRRLRARLRWNLRGDRVTKEFFRGVWEKSAYSIITQLRAADGRVVSDQEGLSDVYVDFYSHLYTTEPITPAHEAATHAFVNLIPGRFSESTQASLSKPLEQAKLQQVVEAMVEGKSLGLDGIAIQFFTKYWDFIGDEFTAMLQLVYATGSLPSQMNRGLITLFHKGGERKDLGNWRPITLLSVAYKVLAKALQRQLQHILPDIISEDQSAFLLL